MEKIKWKCVVSGTNFKIFWSEEALFEPSERQSVRNKHLGQIVVADISKNGFHDEAFLMESGN